MKQKTNPFKAQSIVPAKKGAKKWTYTPTKKDPTLGEFYEESDTHPGEMYKVVRRGKNVFTCSCKGWIFHRHCKHIRRVQEKLKLPVTY